MEASALPMYYSPKWAPIFVEQKNDLQENLVKILLNKYCIQVAE